MNQVKRQLLMLFALITFLSMITIFHVTMTNSQTNIDESNKTEANISDDPDPSEEQRDSSEGGNLFIQSINGWKALLNDVSIGIELLVNQTTE